MFSDQCGDDFDFLNLDFDEQIEPPQELQQLQQQLPPPQQSQQPQQPQQRPQSQPQPQPQPRQPVFTQQQPQNPHVVLTPSTSLMAQVPRMVPRTHAAAVGARPPVVAADLPSVTLAATTAPAAAAAATTAVATAPKRKRLGGSSNGSGDKTPLSPRSLRLARNRASADKSRERRRLLLEQTTAEVVVLRRELGAAQAELAAQRAQCEELRQHNGFLQKMLLCFGADMAGKGPDSVAVDTTVSSSPAHSMSAAVAAAAVSLPPPSATIATNGTLPSHEQDLHTQQCSIGGDGGGGSSKPFKRARTGGGGLGSSRTSTAVLLSCCCIAMMVSLDGETGGSGVTAPHGGRRLLSVMNNTPPPAPHGDGAFATELLHRATGLLQWHVRHSSSGGSGLGATAPRHHHHHFHHHHHHRHTRERTWAYRFAVLAVLLGAWLACAAYAARARNGAVQKPGSTWQVVASRGWRRLSAVTRRAARCLSRANGLLPA